MTQREQALFLELAAQARAIEQRCLAAARAERTDDGYLTAAQGAVLTGKPSGEAFRAWARRKGVVGVLRGRELLYDARDIERALHGKKHRRAA